MNQIPRCDWLTEQARCSYLARSGFLAWSRKINFFFFFVFYPILTKLVRSKWMDIGIVGVVVVFFFCVFIDRDEPNKLGQ